MIFQNTWVIGNFLRQLFFFIFNPFNLFDKILSFILTTAGMSEGGWGFSIAKFMIYAIMIILPLVFLPNYIFSFLTFSITIIPKLWPLIRFLSYYFANIIAFPFHFVRLSYNQFFEKKEKEKLKRKR